MLPLGDHDDEGIGFSEISMVREIDLVADPLDENVTDDGADVVPLMVVRYDLPEERPPLVIHSMASPPVLVWLPRPIHLQIQLDCRVVAWLGFDPQCPLSRWVPDPLP